MAKTRHESESRSGVWAELHVQLGVRREKDANFETCKQLVTDAAAQDSYV